MLTSTEVAVRLGYKNWRAVAQWCKRSDHPLPPRIIGSRRFRARDVMTWFRTLSPLTDLGAALSDARCTDPPQPVLIHDGADQSSAQAGQLGATAAFEHAATPNAALLSASNVIDLERQRRLAAARLAG